MAFSTCSKLFSCSYLLLSQGPLSHPNRTEGGDKGDNQKGLELTAVGHRYLSDWVIDSHDVVYPCISLKGGQKSWLMVFGFGITESYGNRSGDRLTPQG